MTNYGNTGQRYKMSKFAKVERLEDGKLCITLACGHNWIVESGYLPFYEEMIAKGKKTRCDDCAKGVSWEEGWKGVHEALAAQAESEAQA
jgi:hypothetical protein